MTNPALTVVIPVYNEAETIVEVVGRVRALFMDAEIILVDDHSTDGTQNLLGEFAGREGVRVLFQASNLGKGAALRRAFSVATGEVIIIQDADLEYDPNDISRVLAPILRDDADVVYGSRFLDHTVPLPWLTRMGNWVLTAASNFTTGLQLTDMETGYKAFRRQALESVLLEQDRFGIEPELTAKLARGKWRFAEVPIRYTPRTYAEGKKIGWLDLFNAMYCILKYGGGQSPHNH